MRFHVQVLPVLDLLCIDGPPLHPHHAVAHLPAAAPPWDRYNGFFHPVYPLDGRSCCIQYRAVGPQRREWDLPVATTVWRRERGYTSVVGAA
jgi:hypothetical protein